VFENRVLSAFPKEDLRVFRNAINGSFSDHQRFYAAGFRSLGFRHDNAHRKFCNKAAVIVASVNLRVVKTGAISSGCHPGFIKEGGS
jgi:hypothetical protein